MSKFRSQAPSAALAPGARFTSSSLTLVLGALIGGACAPPFSELHSARLVGPGRVEITPSYSEVHFSGENGNRTLQTHMGVQLATGIAERADVRFRLERISLSDGDGTTDVFVVGGGPKLEMETDRLAFYLPMGFAFGNGIDPGETLQAHPTILLTVPLVRGLDVTGSTKARVGINSDPYLAVAFNLGLGIGQNLGPFVVRPEVGMLLTPGAEAPVRHFSLAVAYTGGTRR